MDRQREAEEPDQRNAAYTPQSDHIQGRIDEALIANAVDGVAPAEINDLGTASALTLRWPRTLSTALPKKDL